MNTYPVWWDTTITIYNKFTDPQTRVISWYSHTLDKCFWKYTGDKVVVGKTVIETDSTICRIPAQSPGRNATKKNATYLDKYAWESLSNDKMSDYYTIGVGDIIIKGEVDDIMDEYTPGHRSSDILAKYKKLQGGILIEAFTINVGPGRCSEHYYVKGV